MLKVDLHAHTADDPADPIPYSTFEFIDRAACLRFDAVAVTLHDRQLDLGPYRSYARARGITLIPGIERTVCGRHVLLLNYGPEAASVRSFVDISRLKRDRRGLVIAPHPFFPAPSALRGYMERYADLFDAVEYNAMFTSLLNFNILGERWARRHGKPMVGSGDVHRLEMLGTTYSLVDAPPDADAICAAVAAGRVEVVARPHSPLTAGRLMAELALHIMPPRPLGAAAASA